VIIADGWGVFRGGDARADQGGVGEAGIFARFIAEIRPAVALLSGVVNARSPVHFAAALHRATGVWCLPIDVGFALNLGDVTVKTPGGNLRVNDVHVAESGGRLKYAAASP
jgi:hypothetical protein